MEGNHRQSYIICATPRSGSTLLCDLLNATGIAGNPDSFFRHESYVEWADYLSVSTLNWSTDMEFDREYLAAVIKQGKSGTPVFGMRLMWESLAALSRQLDVFFPESKSDHARFVSAFGSPLYIHLSRRDKVAQAVSHLRAEQSGLWHRHADGSERERLKPAAKADYNFLALQTLVSETEAHDDGWSRWFEQHDIHPLTITYEELSENPQAQLAGILTALGQNPTIAKTIKPISAKLADDLSQEWIAQFRAEMNQ